MYSKLIKKMTSAVAIIHLWGGKKSITKMLRSIKCTNCWTYAWVLSICYAYNKQLKKKGPEND